MDEVKNVSFSESSSFLSDKDNLKGFNIYSFDYDSKKDFSSQKSGKSFSTLSLREIFTEETSGSDPEFRDVDYLKKKEKEFFSDMDRAISMSNFEYGFSSHAEFVLGGYLETTPTYTKQWLQSYFLKSFEYPDRLVSILRVVQNVRSADLLPEGAMLALSALSHRDIEVKENAIRCFENWHLSEHLSVLENVEVTQDWLQDYIKEVIHDLQSQ